MKQLLMIFLLLACIKVNAQDPAYPTAPAVPLNIVRAEYFIDTDPGFGNGTTIPLTAAADIPALLTTINTASLTAGAHRLFVRTLNAESAWSITTVRQFIVDFDPAYPSVAAPLNVVKAEYFIDTDPGFHNGVNIPVTAALDIAGLVTSINTASLTVGVHRLYVRTLNAEGEWSITSVRPFVVDFDPVYPATPAAPLNITKAEYFIDTDPGFGNGINIALSAATNIPALIAGIHTNLLAAGAHTLYVRSLNAEGEWSLVSFRQFIVNEDPAYPAAPPAPGNITYAEYFFNTDPGFGNGTPITLTPGIDISNLNVTVNTSTLPPGLHRFYIRSFDDWGFTNVRELQVNSTLPVRFTNFTAKVSGSDVVLNWQTASEQNSSHFEVERSTDGITFKKIGQVAAAGNSTTELSYVYTDADVTDGMYYYRLRQVDLDNKSMYSGVLRVTVSQKAELQLIPNPVANRLFIKGVPVNTRFSITDINGRLVMNAVWTGQPIELSTLPAGYYTLRVLSTTQVISKSFIKQ